MADGGWLTKSEVNALYYATVSGEISFATEASMGFHPGAVARLISHQAADLGKRAIRILEIGANDWAFGRELIDEIGTGRNAGRIGIDRVDYLAVELARPSLEAIAIWGEQYGYFDLVVKGPAGLPLPLGEPPARPAMVALAVIEDEITVNVGFVHAEATQFVRANAEPFDFVILNELLDDMPCRAYFAGSEGGVRELVPAARVDGGRWTVRVAAEATEDAPDLAAGTITATSPAWVELVTGAARSLRPGGMLLVHDYGFAEPSTSLAKYAALPASVPSFAELVFPGDAAPDFPRGFFRVYGDDAKGVLQVTNDVNFAEITGALEPFGTSFSIPQGSSVINAGKDLEQGSGVFLAEFGLLEPGDDLPGLLARLEAGQAGYRDDYAAEYTDGRGNVFLDLVFVKS